MLGLLPPRLTAGLLGALALLMAVKFFVASIERRGYDKCQAAHNAVSLAAQQDNARTQILKHDRNLEIADSLRKSAAREAAVRADLVSQLERLRQSAAAIGRGAAAGPAQAASGADGADELRRLLAEGAQRAVELGAVAEEGRSRLAEAADRVTGLQNYAANVCGTTKE